MEPFPSVGIESGGVVGGAGVGAGGVGVGAGGVGVGIGLGEQQNCPMLAIFDSSITTNAAKKYS